jgi:hypothetical protein
MFGTIYFLWRACNRFSVGNLVGLVVFTGLSLVSKFSAALLILIATTLLVINIWPRQKLKPLPALGMIATLFFTSWLVVWATYGFRYSPSQNKTWTFQFDQDIEARTNAPALARMVGYVDEHRLVPNAFSQGFLRGQAKMQIRSSFLNGHYSLNGWWYYFPCAFLMKTPSGLILLMLAGMVVCAWRWRSFLENNIFLILPIAFYLGIALTQRLNIGIRHILPIYPFVLMLAGLAIAEVLNRRKPVLQAVLAATILLCVIEFAHAYPHNLAFFNSLAGGPRNGYKHLVDSNLDWGQDLPALRRWLDERNLNSPSAPAYLSYFGTADVAYHGINIKRLPGDCDLDNPVKRFPLAGGTYCISATLLQGIYTLFQGPWAAPYEDLYKQTTANIRLLEQSQGVPAMQQQLINLHGETFWNQQYNYLIALRFNRLCAYLRQRTPDDRLGYSILIYHLTDQQVEEALSGPPAQLTPTIQIKGFPNPP